MLRTNSKSAVITPASSSSSQGKSIGTCNAQKTGQPPATSGYNDFSFDFDFGSDFDSGGLQPLNSERNLGVVAEYDNASQSKSAASQQQFVLDVSNDGSRAADSANEDGEPAPPLAKTTPEPAQPSVQLSDDPAMAALEQALLNDTQGVTFYGALLSILDKALADHPQMPRNAFDGLKNIFSNAQAQCATRAADLANETQQLRNDRGSQARALAAQAQGNGAPVAPGSQTFSATPTTPISIAELDLLMKEVDMLPEPAQRGPIIQSLQTVLGDVGGVTGADLDREMRQMQWDLDNPGLKGVDPEIFELHKQLNEDEVGLNEEVKKLGQWGEDLNHLQFPADSVDPDWYEFADPTPPLNSTPTRTKEKTVASRDTKNLPSVAPAKTPDIEFNAEIDALLRELENSPVPVPPPIVEKNENKPIGLSEEARKAIDGEVARYMHSTFEALETEITAVKNRPYTRAENKSPKIRADKTKHRINSVIAKHYQAQQGIVTLATQELGAIENGTVLSDEPSFVRMQRVAELQAKRQACLSLMDSMALKTYHLWA